MFEWHKTIQKMINTIEEELDYGDSDDIALTVLSQKLGYSKYHVTKHFKALTGITFRNYLRLRRLAYSVVELRDTKQRIIDIAIKYGFSSQEAYTRAFKVAYGLTPNEYRKRKMPLMLKNKQNIFDPYYLGIGESSMNKNELQEVSIKKVTLTAHKFLHIKNICAHDYSGFWKLQERIPGQDCNTICGLLDSIGASVCMAVDEAFNNYDFEANGYSQDKSAVVYQIHNPERVGYRLYVPVKEMK